jgi:hypothetical protein
MAQAANKSDAAAPASELVLAEDSFLPTYSWSQTLADVSICVPLPANISAKMLDIVFQRQSIKVAIKGGRTILTGTLSATVYPDDCFWTLDKGCVEITLSKVTRPSRRTPFAPARWQVLRWLLTRLADQSKTAVALRYRGRLRSSIAGRSGHHQ